MLNRRRWMMSRQRLSINIAAFGCIRSIWICPSLGIIARSIHLTLFSMESLSKINETTRIRKQCIH
ncbi:maker240 [Drosophila busckii]|uniref:Maker240 n=1 Tax=Drosophila busckii TaxID=30019 RepID=A0A0M4F6Y0_DROBS|nr:maker240 [Drosophila busckii]